MASEAVIPVKWSSGEIAAGLEAAVQQFTVVSDR